jgi:membrane protein DedA with SNARE-associated domain
MRRVARAVPDASDVEENDCATVGHCSKRLSETMNQITQFLTSYGGLFLFAAGFMEQSGLPFPGGLCVMAAGALAASGKYSVIAAVCWAAAGCVAADVIWFHLGHRGKSSVFRVFPHLHAVQSRLRQATLTGSVLHGTRMLTVAKFLPLGTVIPLHAGAMEVGSLRFLVVDIFTSLVYAVVYASLGFTFHNQLERVATFLRKLGAASLVLIVVSTGIYFVHWYLKHRRNAHLHVEPNEAKRDICVT